MAGGRAQPRDGPPGGRRPRAERAVDQFTEEDFTFSEQLPIVMTEKDAARCHKIDIKNIWVLKIEADLPDNFALELINKIKEEDE